MSSKPTATLLALLLAACRGEQTWAEHEPVREQPLGTIAISPALIESGRVTHAKVERRPVTGVLNATGIVEAPPDGAADVTSPIAARVKTIHVRPGDEVAAGALLATLEAGEIARVASEAERARARRIHAERVLAQEERLAKEDATSERAVSEARSELLTARAEERAARTLLSSWGGRGSELRLRSPIAGAVVRLHGVTGAPVDATAPLLRVVDPRRLQLRVEVAEDVADEVADGSRAVLVARGGKSCDGTVQSHAPVVDPKTRTVPFRIVQSAACGDLHEGAFFDVTLERAGRKRLELPAVPRDAVVSIDEVPVVFIAGSRPGDYTMRSIRVAEYAGPTVYVDDGLSGGELVAVSGALLLKGEILRARLGSE
jgi:membrane fusion protein, heavy metal efflux system